MRWQRTGSLKLWQFILSLAHKSSRRNLADTTPSGKAPEGWRSPGRFAYFRNHRIACSVLECGPDASAPLFPEAYQTVAQVNWNCSSVHQRHRRRRRIGRQQHLPAHGPGRYASLSSPSYHTGEKSNWRRISPAPVRS
jgi:hypothetical protein